MKKLKVVVCKASKGVSAHLPEVDGYVIARDTVSKLKKDLREGVQFHIEGLYEEERQPWMAGEYEFEYVFKDIPSLIEAYSDCINQSSLARMAGINAGQMRQYASGVKRPAPQTLERIEQGVRKYARELQAAAFDMEISIT
jgi:predicted RNase H-like HicB family nuclease